jgi:NAD+ synthase (glutamine-hydrolysing)
LYSERILDPAIEIVFSETENAFVPPRINSQIECSLPRIAMAQINTTVGDLEGNKRRVVEFGQRALQEAADIVAFPEMTITGYPPLDLLPPREVRPPAGNRRPNQEDFVRLNKKCVFDVAKELVGITAIVGFVDYDDSNLYNAAAILSNGRIQHVAYKTLLPTYDVFDEHRYFKPALKNVPVSIDLGDHKISLGTSICEDIWDEEIGYGVKVVDELVADGAMFIVNLNASPFHDKIRDVRLRILRTKARRLGTAICYVNLIGGQDELVFDGESLAVDCDGRLIGVGRQFEEDLIIVDIKNSGSNLEIPEPRYNREEGMFNALVLGVRDYFRKTGFSRAFIGLSGGIDSSLVAVIAATALGNESVTGVSMPSRFSSDHSKLDAEELARNLGIAYASIPIETVFETFEAELKPHFKGKERDVAEENLQSRIRGNILMTLSNKFGDLVLATGNKTELALGYATLYGDMSGGLEVIGDVSKTEVYALATYYNRHAGREVIPKNCFTKIPSAELRPEQFDPFDYPTVSPLVDDVIENRLSREELLKKGYPTGVVDDTLRRIRGAEYKRRQAPPAIKITKKAFGLGWKMPLVNKFRY